MTPWISVYDQLPPLGVTVQVYANTFHPFPVLGRFLLAVLISAEKQPGCPPTQMGWDIGGVAVHPFVYNQTELDIGVTHWRHLPEPKYPPMED